MKFNVIALTSRSLTIELENEDIYYASRPFDVTVNSRVYKKGEKKNVVSLFGLEPDTDYMVEVVQDATGESCCSLIRTEKEFVRLDVRKFGAVGDGKKLDSLAIQAAIMACPKNGTVYLPKGVYHCAPLFLKSDMILELDEEAVILGHPDRELYPIMPGYTTTTDETDEYYLGTWEGNPLDKHASLISAVNVENVSIVGKGIIDGNAQNSDWWDDPKRKKDAWRPRTIFFKGCDNMLVQGVTVQNSPAWTIHPFLSSNLSFIDLKVRNHKDSPNTDGLDPESCSDIKIIGVEFSVGDDCIAIKSGKLYMGRKLKRPSERFVIRNCKMQHGHGAVVLGSEMSGGVKDIEVSRCIFEKTDRGLRIKTRRGRGEEGVIDGILFDRIKMKEVLTPFVINMFYFCDPDGKSEYVWSKESLPVDEWTPYLGKFHFRRIDCIDCEVAAGCFYGLPEQPIEEVIMEDIRVMFKDQARTGKPAMMSFAQPVSKKGVVAENVNRIHLKNVRIDGSEGDRLTTSSVKESLDDWADDKNSL